MIRNLAYIGFSSPSWEEWRTFGPDVLGAALATDAGDGVRLRVDDRAWRVAVHPGDVNDVAYFGWQVEREDVATVCDRARRLGCEVVEGDEAVAEDRGVGRLSWFRDPFGFRHELVDQVGQGEPFVPGRTMVGSFVTGEQGLGHVVLMVPELDAGRELALDVLGMRLSDTIDMGGSELLFFHCAGRASRHHTVAMSATPGLVGLHHLMLEVAELDDVGTALDLVRERGIPLAMGLGRHTNDRMTSFYVRTPSGFEIEYGTGGILVDDDTWQPDHYTSGSSWGHHEPEEAALRPEILRAVGR